MNQDLTQELAAAQAELAASKEATARAEAKIAAVQTELNKPTPWERWKPEDGEQYSYVDAEGDVCTNPWGPNFLENCRYDFGNCFQTEQTAKRHALRIRSMVPTCPVPKVGDECWWVNSEFYAFKDRWADGKADRDVYLAGRVFATKEAAEAWIAEFADAWTTLEDASCP